MRNSTINKRIILLKELLSQLKDTKQQLEHQLEIKAIQKIKADNIYLEYDKLLYKKDLLVSELDYLIPTIPGLCPATIDSSGVDELFEKLTRLEVV